MAAIVVGLLGIAVAGTEWRDAHLHRRTACRDFFECHPAVRDAAHAIRSIAAVPRPADATPTASGVLAQQPRWSSFETPSFIPASVEDTRQHVERVLQHDFDSVPADDSLDHGLSPSLTSAIEWTAQHGAQAAMSRETIAESLIDIVERFDLPSVTSEAMRRFAYTHVHKHCATRGTPDAALVAACSIAFCMTDAFLCADIVVGMLVDGMIDATGNWIAKPGPEPTVLTTEFCAQQNEVLINDLSQASSSATDSACYEKTIEETEIGTMQGPFQFRELFEMFNGHFLLHKRFGVVQDSNVRPCDDAALSGFNAAVQMMESLRCITADWPARVATAFANLLPQDGSWSLEISTDDIAKAYRMVTTCIMYTHGL